MFPVQHIFGCALLALLVCNAQAQAQAPELEWQRCLGGSGPEYSLGVQVSADGGYAVLGKTRSNDGDVTGYHGFWDAWLIRLDADGNLLWQRCYGGTDVESANTLLATSDGGFLLLGGSGSMDGDVDCVNTASHAWALKVDQVGSIQWQVCLGTDPDGSGGDFYRAVETIDGGYLAVGSTFAKMGIWQENHGSRDFFAVKLNGEGQLQWLRCYGGSGSEAAYAVRGTPDAGFVIAGTCGSWDGQVTTGEQGSVWVIRIDADGNLLWNRRMGGSTGPGMGQEARDLVVNPDGSVLVVGSAGANDGDISGNHGELDVWLVLLDSNGTILRQRCFGGSGWDSAWGGAAAGQGRYAIAGYTGSNDGDVSGYHGGTGKDAWVLMVDADLNLLWQKCLGGTESEAAFAMAYTHDREVVISGHTHSTDGDVIGLHPPGADDIWVVKLASDAPTGIAGRSGGGMVVFPSPTNDAVNIRFPHALPANASLDVLDINGRLVLHERLEGRPGIRQINVASWVPGVYALRLYLGAEMHTTRFVKQ